MFNAICDIITNAKKYNANFYVHELSIMNAFGGEAMVYMNINLVGCSCRSVIYRTNKDVYVIMSGQQVLAKGDPHNYELMARQLDMLLYGVDKETPSDLSDEEGVLISEKYKGHEFSVDDVMLLKPYYDMLDSIGNKFYIVFQDMSHEISIAIHTITNEYRELRRVAMFEFPSYEMYLIDVNDNEENIVCSFKDDRLALLKEHIINEFSIVNDMIHTETINSIRNF